MPWRVIPANRTNRLSLARRAVRNDSGRRTGRDAEHASPTLPESRIGIDHRDRFRKESRIFRSEPGSITPQRSKSPGSWPARSNPMPLESPCSAFVFVLIRFSRTFANPVELSGISPAFAVLPNLPVETAERWSGGFACSRFVRLRRSVRSGRFSNGLSRRTGPRTSV